jgi:spermidine synthase
MLYVIFFLSGISGLVYETVWLRMLIRVLGSTAYATAVVLAGFMAGLALGSYLIGRYTATARNPLRIYALLELGVAMTALGLTLALGALVPVYRVVYDLLAGSRFGLTIFQSALSFVILIVPTCLMGGTLPVLSAHTKTHQIDFSPRISLLYGLNTLGAVVGVLASGIYTIGAWGETATVLGGVTVTTVVALVAWRLSERFDAAAAPQATGQGGTTMTSTETAARPEAAISPYPESTRRLVGAAYAVSGLTAMAYEIAWTRLFQIQVGTSIYAFSIMLAFYLAGIAVGSLLAAPWIGRTRRPLLLFGFAQMGIAAYGLAGMHLSTFFDPVSLTLTLNLKNVLVLPLIVVFPITVVLGLLFPAVSRSYVANESDVSRAVGRLYALNTLGCIIGSLLTGFVLLSVLGTRWSMVTLAGLNMALGAAVLVKESSAFGRMQTYATVAAGAVLTLGLAVVVPDPFLWAVRRSTEVYFGSKADQVEIYYNKESIAATTTAMGFRGDPLGKHLWINGIGMTNLCEETKILAHLPLLLHENPKRILVVCFGMGTTVRSARSHKDVDVSTVELVPEVYECFSYFHADGREVLADPRVHPYVDDGRNFLLMRPETYDVIAIDPAPPVWAAGTVNLYTKEFFEICRGRLTSNGITCLWVPPVEATEVRMIMKTFQAVFPQTYLWRGLSVPQQGFYLMGHKKPGPIDLARLDRANNDQAIVKDLNEWTDEKVTPGMLRNLLVFTPDALVRLVANDPVISDDHPYTEFPLWRSLFDPAYGARLTIAK